MAKGQQMQSAGQVNQANVDVQKDVGNVENNLGPLQARQDTQANETLAQSKGYAAPAADTYTNFAKTGGFSPSDETTYLNRATQGVKGTYDVLAKAGERQRMAAGGLGTGGEFSQMARQGGQAQAQATENAQADLKQQENYNKLQGAGGLSGLYSGTNALYNTQTNALSETGRQILQGLGLKYSTEEEGAQILAELSKNPGNFDNVLRTITALKPGYSSSRGFTAGG